MQLGFDQWKEETVAGSQAWRIVWRRHQLDSILSQKFTVAAAVWALAISWYRCSPRRPVPGRFSHQLSNTLGRQKLVYQSAVTVRQSSSGIVVSPASTSQHSWLLNFTRESSHWKTHTVDCCFVSGSYWYIHVSSPVRRSHSFLDCASLNFLFINWHQRTQASFDSSDS